MFTLGPTYPKNLFGRLLGLGSTLARENRPIDRVVAPIRRPVDRAYYVYSGKLRELGKLGDSVAQRQHAASGKRILVLSLRMWTTHTAYESVVAQALRLRGAEVAMLTCGGGQPICEVGWGRRVAPRPCDRCAYFTDRLAGRGRFVQFRLADEFPWGPSPSGAPSEVAAPPGRDVSEAAHASVAWFTRSADARRARNGPAIEKDFGISVAEVTAAVARILDRFRPDVVFALNGLFAAERAVRAAAAEGGVRVVTYEMAPRKDTLVFGQTNAAP